jgi:enterochelin esterase family protein
MTSPATTTPTSGHQRKLAINRLRDRLATSDAGAVDRFLQRHTAPIIEGRFATFLWRGDAEEVMVRHRVVGLPDPLNLRRLADTDLWHATIELPEGSRVEYQFEVVRGGVREEYLNDPLNPRLAHGPFGSQSVAAASGYVVPSWTLPDPEARPGTIDSISMRSRALRREQWIRLYRPARFREVRRYPLLIVHDGDDYLNYAAAKTVLDNLIHRGEVAPLVAAFIPPGNRLVEYANHAPHARFVARELVPYLTEELPLLDLPDGWCLMGSSFGGVASLSTAVRYPSVFGSLLLESGSFVFTDIGAEHGGGPVFDPVVKFVNGYRARPRVVADRIYQTCGIYEPLITPNRSMVSTFRDTGMDVRYVEARDGHNWENWRDRLRDALTWIFPGEQKFVYE